jgi:hypothetical protein
LRGCNGRRRATKQTDDWAIRSASRLGCRDPPRRRSAETSPRCRPQTCDDAVGKRRGAPRSARGLNSPPGAAGACGPARNKLGAGGARPSQRRVTSMVPGRHTPAGLAWRKLDRLCNAAIRGAQILPAPPTPGGGSKGANDNRCTGTWLGRDFSRRRPRADANVPPDEIRKVACFDQSPGKPVWDVTHRHRAHRRACVDAPPR